MIGRDSSLPGRETRRVGHSLGERAHHSAVQASGAVAGPRLSGGWCRPGAKLPQHRIRRQGYRGMYSTATMHNGTRPGNDVAFTYSRLAIALNRGGIRVKPHPSLY